MPVLENTSHNPSATLSTSTLFSSTASGYLLAKQIAVNRYLYPDLDLGNGPTKSKANLENGTSSTGRGLRGALPTLALLAFWQRTH